MQKKIDKQDDNKREMANNYNNLVDKMNRE